MTDTSDTGIELELLHDPTAFLDVAGAYLAAEPVINTVVTTIAHRTVALLRDGGSVPDEDWWLVVRDRSGAVVGAGMRNAPFEPRPAFLLPMPEEAAVALARAVHARGEVMAGVNGALPASETCARELARLSGGTVRVSQHTRLHELDEVVRPTPCPGRLEVAGEEHLDLAMEWFGAFMSDADEQAGREPGASPHEVPTAEGMLRKIASGRVWLWVDDAGEPVHLTAGNPPSFGVSRLGPVYTPPAQRGRGWASNAVAEVSRRLQSQGERVCLFTDQANPTSNKIYAAVGYRPVVDMANYVRPPPQASPRSARTPGLTAAIPRRGAEFAQPL